jgi:hypothetical protein
MFTDAPLDVLVVWIALKEGDTLEAARKAVGKFTDARVRQFFDPKQRAGKAIADCLGYGGKTAWDFYLFYPPGAEWREIPPGPEVYMHQLRNNWADQNRLFEKDGLRMELTRTMKALFP